MNWNPIIVLSILFLAPTTAVRLHKLFQYIDGYRSDYNLKGFLHIGYEYAVFIRLPKTHDRFLIYELYQTRKGSDGGDGNNNNPKIIAISKVPIAFLKEQLKTYRQELYRVKYVDENVVPGTEVLTLREWQIDRALKLTDGFNFDDKPSILRTLL